jgi:leader peptidase (prepilin peptidase)/N-methyltransferase
MGGDILLQFGAFGLGAILGSFLNAVIYRLPRKLSLANPARSFCPPCGKQLSWRENIPLLSWLLQRGRCSCGKEQIPLRYFLVELISALCGVFALNIFGLNATGAVIFALLLALVAISFIDLDHKIIPDKISYPGMILGLILGVVSQHTDIFSCSPFQSLCPISRGAADSLLGFIVGGGFFWGIGWLYFVVTGKDGLGFGDVKLMGMLGAILGVSSVAPTIILGSLVGSVVGIGAMIATGGGRHTEIPFGPWLAIGAVIYIFFDPGLFRLV